ncbi:MAG: tyrosine recombinase XerC [Verrucomicrobiia bacterium]
MQSAKIPQNGQSGQEVAKQVAKQNQLTPPMAKRKAAVSRFSSVYWEDRVYRPFYTREGKRMEVAQYYVRVKHGDRREQVPLATNTQDEAARRAAKLFKTLKQDGWEVALRLFRPDTEPLKNKSLTVGRYLDLVDEYAPLAPRTFSNYAYSIRRIAADVGRLKLAKGVNRFDPKGPWRDSANAVHLEAITPVAVEDWRARYLKEHRGNPVEEQQAGRSVNSFIRNARALFSRRILDAMHKHAIELPDPLPFATVRLEQKTGSTRYRSQIDAGALLQAAQAELAEGDPDGYATVLLALGAGLRRSEIDGLQWQQVMPDRGVIRVMTTAARRTKSAESEGDVQVDAGLFAELERTRRPGKTLFVIEPDTEHPKSKSAQVYRAAKTFDRVTSWLRKQGVMTEKPLHTLRKEFGSVVAAAGDIFQAQRQLRHAQISTTEQYYADARTRATMQIGAMLKGKADAPECGKP